MKTYHLARLIATVVIAVLITGCTKLADLPIPFQPVVKTQTIPDNTTIRIQLINTKDTLQADGIIIGFDHTMSEKYVPGEDAPTLKGFGAESLSALSSDSVTVAIDWTPYTPGMIIQLQATSHNGGSYMIREQGAVHALIDTTDLFKHPYMVDLKGGVTVLKMVVR